MPTSIATNNTLIQKTHESHILSVNTDNKKKGRKKMLCFYIDNCIYIVMVVTVADFILRLFKLLREYFFYSNYYMREQRLWQMIRRCYSYSNGTLVLFCICGCIMLYRATTSNIGKSKHSYSIFPPAVYWIFMPMWLAFYFANFGYSNLNYAEFVRENHGLDYAEGMASNYFHGYLKLTLPSMTGRPGLRERIEQYEAENNVTFAIKRLFILVPSAMFVHSEIKSHKMEKAKPLSTTTMDRAGVSRPFGNAVYRLSEPINNTYYYVALEGATPVLSFFEAMNFQLSTTWQMKEMQREILFKFYKRLHKLLTKWPETQQEVELIFYNSYTEDGCPQDVGEVVLAHIKNYWKKYASP